MSIGIRRPHEAVDFAAIERLYPPPPEYFETAYFDDRETIERTPARPPAATRRGARYEVPFFRRPLGRRGLRPRPHPHARRPVEVARLHRRRHPQEHRRRTRRSATTRASRPPIARREPMRVFMSGGTTGKSRPTFYTQWDRDGRRGAHGAGACTARHPARRRRAQLVGVRLAQRRVLLRRGAVPLAQLRGAHHEHRQRHVHREAGRARHRVRRHGDPHDRRLPAAHRRRRRETWATTRQTDLKLRALPNIGDPEVLTETFGVEYFRSLRLPRGAVGREPSARRTTACTSSRTRFVVQIVDPETGEPLPDGELGSLVRHRALQDRQPAVPVQHHGPVVAVPARAVRRAGRGCARWARSPAAATTWSSSAASTCGPRRVGDIACTVDGIDARLLRAGRPRGQPRRARACRSCPIDPAADARRDPRSRSSGACSSSSASRSTPTVVAPGRARRAHRAPHLAQAQALPRRAPGRQGREPPAPGGIVDTSCNAFTPDREAVWDDAIAGQGVPIKVRRDPADAFAEPDAMVARMDELGIDTLLVPTSDLHRHGTPFEYDPVAVATRRDGGARRPPTPAGSPRGGRSTPAGHGRRAPRRRDARATVGASGCGPPHAQLRPPLRPRRLLPLLRARRRARTCRSRCRPARPAG